MLAIVIPYFKILFFEETIKSLANQTNKQFNIYIGDDASPEPPNLILQKYNYQLNFTYHRFDENLGGTSLVKQWERCIDLIQNEDWLMILGDDDYLSNNAVESWCKNYKNFEGKSNLVRFATKIVNQNDKTLSETYEHPIWENAVEAYWRKNNHATRSSLSEYVFSRAVYDKYGFQNFPLAWNSDDCAWLDFSDYKPIYSINEGIVFIGISTSNISGKNDNLILKRHSQIAFYKYLISKKDAIFSKKELLLLMRKYEVEILKERRITSLEWLYLLLKYIKYFDKKDTKKFIKRLLNTILKHYEY